MNRLIRLCISSLCFLSLFISSGITTYGSQEGEASPILVYGSVKKEQEQLLMNPDTSGPIKEEVLRITPSPNVKILDATTGFPVSFDEIKDGEMIYAYVSSAMTLSLPPMVNASVLLCNIPENYQVPEYITVSSVETLEHSNAKIHGNNKNTYMVSSTTTFFPYLTRNVVSIHDLSPGKSCLVWTEKGSLNATKVMVFPQETLTTTGWILSENTWYYYNPDGSLHTGWLLDGDDWYYLNPSDGSMATGFLVLEGKTYYLLENGKMLTTQKMIKPDSNGVLSIY